MVIREFQKMTKNKEKNGGNSLIHRKMGTSGEFVTFKEEHTFQKQKKRKHKSKIFFHFYYFFRKRAKITQLLNNNNNTQKNLFSIGNKGELFIKSSKINKKERVSLSKPNKTGKNKKMKFLKNIAKKLTFLNWIVKNEETLRSRGIKIYSSVLFKKEPKEKIINSIIYRQVSENFPVCNSHINTTERRFKKC